MAQSPSVAERSPRAGPPSRRRPGGPRPSGASACGPSGPPWSC